MKLEVLQIPQPARITPSRGARGEIPSSSQHSSWYRLKIERTDGMSNERETDARAPFDCALALGPSARRGAIILAARWLLLLGNQVFTAPVAPFSRFQSPVLPHSVCIRQSRIASLLVSKIKHRPTASSLPSRAWLAVAASCVRVRCLQAGGPTVLRSAIERAPGATYPAQTSEDPWNSQTARHQRAPVQVG